MLGRLTRQSAVILPERARFACHLWTSSSEFSRSFEDPANFRSRLASLVLGPDPRPWCRAAPGPRQPCGKTPHACGGSVAACRKSRPYRANSFAFIPHEGPVARRMWHNPATASAQKIGRMGRVRVELTITAVSRRYPNQLDYRPIKTRTSSQTLLRFNRKVQGGEKEQGRHA